MKETFLKWNPRLGSITLLVNIDEILKDYKAQGYRLTLRQLYYQLVAKDKIANEVASYNSLINVVSRGRLAGYIDWDMIEDRMRVPLSNAHWNDPTQIVKAASESFYMSRWKDQKNYIEIWCEKDAVSNIIQPVCREWDVTFMANRGYCSQTALYDAAKRIVAATLLHKDVTIIYLGDHDPSGIDMTRDIANRLGTLIFKEKEMSFPTVRRIALNMDQIIKLKPPENPAKVTDSRYDAYVTRYGQSSWELDALDPSFLSQLIDDTIAEYVETEKFEDVAVEEERLKDKIRGLIEYL